MIQPRTCYAFLIYIIVLFGAAFNPALAQNVRRLTLNPNQDTLPAWNPLNNTIAYMRSKGVSGVPFDVFGVQSDGTGEGPLATGPSDGFGLANSLSWIGFSNFLALEERSFFHEYLAFDASQAPFVRTVLDGDDAAFSTLLQIDGGGGGGLIRFSRFGNVVLVRFSDSGGGGLTTIRTGTIPDLAAQNASEFGTIHVSEDTGTLQKFLAGAALSPDGSFFVLAMPIGATTTPNDLVLFPTDQSGLPVNLTNSAVSGVNNVFPDWSPDGTTILFARVDPVESTAADLYTMNINGSNLKQLTFTPGFSESGPSWSPDGSQIAFVGGHLAGREQDFPALLPGEAANSNIYVMDVAAGSPGDDVVTPQTILDQPPQVVVQGRNVILTFELFLKALLKRGASPVLLLPVKAEAAIPGRSKKVSFRYDAVLQRTSDSAGNLVQNDIRRKTTKRNSLTISDLTPGSYTVKYRVQFTRKKNDKTKVVGATDFSPAAGFVIPE